MKARKNNYMTARRRDINFAVTEPKDEWLEVKDSMTNLQGWILNGNVQASSDNLK